MARTRIAADVRRRFDAKVRVSLDNDCWWWLGPLNQKGYGAISVDGVRHSAHRVALMLRGDTMIPGMTVDHLCRNRSCVRPDHLEQVTNRVNVLRGDTLPAANVAKTECPKGHPLDACRTNGDRYCLTCNRARQRAAYARDPEKERRRSRNRYWLAAMEETRP